MSQLTKEALKQTLLQLLEEEPLDKITVKQLVNHCNINRNTFYYHFHDIFELLEYVFTCEAEKLIKEDWEGDHWKEDVKRVAKYLKEHEKMIHHVYYSAHHDHLENYLRQVVTELLYKAMKEKTMGTSIDDEACAIFSDFFKYAIVGLFEDWIRTGMIEDIEVILSRIEFVIDHSILANIKTTEN